MSEIAEIDKKREREIRFNPYETVYDVVFVLNINSQGWILEKICRVIAENSGLHCKIVFSERNDILTSPLPKSRAYFFGHFAIAYFAFLKEPRIHKARTFIWYTHPDPNKGVSYEGLAKMMSICDRVFVPNANHIDFLEKIGAPRDKIHLVLGGADPAQFTPTPRGQGKVGFVGAYYERKNPDLIFEVIRTNPDIPFVLIGPHPDEIVNTDLLWPSWARFDDLCALPNLDYREVRYEDFGTHYEDIDVLLSLSDVEGGPIPLIEALMSNSLIIATDTGFARDIIQTDVNGRVVPVRCDADTVNEALSWALQHTDEDVATPARETLSWASFGRQISDAMFPTLTEGTWLASDGGDMSLLDHGGWTRPDRTGTIAVRRDAFLSLPTVPPGQATRFTLRVWRADGDDSKTDLRFGALSGRISTFGVHGVTPTTFSYVATSRGCPRADEPYLFQTVILDPTETRKRGIKLGWIESAPAPVVHKTDEIRITAGSPWARLLETNWHAPESAGVWTNGRGRIVLPLAPDLQRGGGFLVVRGRFFGAGAEKPKGMKLVLPELSKHKNWKCHSGEEQAICIEIPVVEHGIDRLVIEFGRIEHTSPKSLDPSSTDDRSLGFFLTSINFQDTALPEVVEADGDKVVASARAGRFGFAKKLLKQD